MNSIEEEALARVKSLTAPHAIAADDGLTCIKVSITPDSPASFEAILEAVRLW